MRLSCRISGHKNQLHYRVHPDESFLPVDRCTPVVGKVIFKTFCTRCGEADSSLFSKRMDEMQDR